MTLSVAERTAKWLVGDQLSCVLHLGDSALAYQLAEHGHEVTIVDSDVMASRHSAISYVCASHTRLPFSANAFDVVITSALEPTQSTLAEFARVLRFDGLLSTLWQRYDGSIPWLRKLHEIVGKPEDDTAAVNTLDASGLFLPAEQIDSGSWEKLDLEALIQFAQATSPSAVSEDSLARVRQLWDSYGARTGSLRLRRQTTCLRAQVDKSALPEQPAAPDVKLFDFR